MNLVEPIPRELEASLRNHLNVGELVLMMLAADLDAGGRYVDSWFVLTSDRILILRLDDDPELEAIALTEIQAIYTRNLVGNGALVVELAGKVLQLIRFSQGAYYKFSSVPPAVEAALAELGRDGLEVASETEQIAPRQIPHCDAIPGSGRFLSSYLVVFSLVINSILSFGSKTFFSLFINSIANRCWLFSLLINSIPLFLSNNPL